MRSAKQRGMRVHAWRGIGAGYNKFVSESFLDEVAPARGVDPLAFRLELTKDHPRAQAVIKAVAEMSNFKQEADGPRPRHRLLRLSRHADGGRRRGVGRQGDRQDQGPQLLDRGRSGPRRSSRRTSQAQIESAIVYGLSGALSEELSMKGGAIQQSNFNDYHVLRMSDMPELHIKIIATDNPPTGMGEVGIPTVAPAIGNAVAQLTGKRLRHLPMSAGPGEEGAGVTPAFAQPCPPRPAGDAAGFFLRLWQGRAAGIS